MCDLLSICDFPPFIFCSGHFTMLNYVIFIPRLFVTWSNAISHIGCWLLHVSMRIIKLQPRFKVGNISYLRVLFHSSMLLLTFWYIIKPYKDQKEKNAFMLQSLLMHTYDREVRKKCMCIQNKIRIKHQIYFHCPINAITVIGVH